MATWSEIEYVRLASFRTTKALLLFIMALVVAVASVNVSSSVIMIIFERRHDLGILKSVGVGPPSLSLSFLLAGFTTGLMGTALGIAVGLLVAVNINEVIAGSRVDGQSCPCPGFPRAFSFCPFRAPARRLYPVQQRVLFEVDPDKNPAARGDHGIRRRASPLCARLLPARIPRRAYATAGNSQKAVAGSAAALDIRPAPVVFRTLFMYNWMWP